MKETEKVKIYDIPVDKVLPNPNQPRKHFDPTAITELAESIKVYGVLQPIQVRKINDSLYELVTGERRLRASKEALKDTIPAVIIEITDKDSAVISIVENVQREDLTFFEEAESYRQLIEYYDLTQEGIAEVLGKSQSAVANKLRLLKLDAGVIEKINEAGLSERHARALLRLPDADLQNDVLEQVIKRDLTVKKTETLVEKVRNEVLINNYDEAITPEKKARVKSFINAQIYINTIKSAFKVVKDSRNTAQYSEKDKEDCIEIKIIIPK